ncbi:hypothetical protein BDR06DRAFT_1005220 [Suillus hirtellus]|nr:hypothetical protein BDR06DRAFT_1005220 [Suillus hirtellus]
MFVLRTQTAGLDDGTPGSAQMKSRNPDSHCGSHLRLRISTFLVVELYISRPGLEKDAQYDHRASRICAGIQRCNAMSRNAVYVSPNGWFQSIQSHILQTKHAVLYVRGAGSRTSSLTSRRLELYDLNAILIPLKDTRELAMNR